MIWILKTLLVFKQKYDLCFYKCIDGWFFLVKFWHGNNLDFNEKINTTIIVFMFRIFMFRLKHSFSLEICQF